MVPKSLKQMVNDSLQQTHPGKLGMRRLVDLVGFPCIPPAQSCPHCIGHCIKNSNNIKPLQSKSNLGTLSKLWKPNEEMDFAGLLTFQEHKVDCYFLGTVDRLTRYPHVQVYKNCDTETALIYLEEYCGFHGIPSSIRCDQAQAFKALEFEIYVKIKTSNLSSPQSGITEQQAWSKAWSKPSNAE